ncbi:MAG: adaptor protein MecA [Agathobacter sp.]|nr:adaptor protein MecA [Agathobacter sp.]
MKIEKVNENQIRCTLTKEDLADRQIKISELAYGSEKARSLFRDMIEQANYEFGFEADDIPLMIEAIPLSGENIILQITKVEYPEELDTRFSKFSEGGEEEEDSSSETNMFSDIQGADDILGLFQKMKEDLEEQVKEKESQVENISVPLSSKESVSNVKEKEIPVNLTKMFEFRNLEQLERLAHVLGGYYTGRNDVYKDENKNRFYLLIRKCKHTPEEFNKVCNIISEYSAQKKYSSATEAFFMEHGKLILKGNALQVLDSL